MTEPLSLIGRASLALVLGLVLVSDTKVLAQGKLRGPAPAGGTPQLPPKPPINLLNNGSLATWPNPNAILPNQVQFAYIAAVPLGDRLGYNGIFYDQEIIPNVGLFTPGGIGWRHVAWPWSSSSAAVSGSAAGPAAHAGRAGTTDAADGLPGVPVPISAGCQSTGVLQHCQWIGQI